MLRLTLLTHRHRFATSNLVLGLLLAFNAGAVNAGGFLVLSMYTSHMTGFASQLADALMQGRATLWLTALGAIIAFICGAAVCAVLVNWSRQRRLRSVYALPLFLEAALMLPFAWVGGTMLSWSTPYAVPLAVLLLAFMMGLQNAVTSKTSGGSIRTTNMTGNITDLGIELGKSLYWNRKNLPHRKHVQHNPARVRTAGGLLAMFVLGGLAGAVGFAYVGFVCVIPLAALLLVLSAPPLWSDRLRLFRGLPGSPTSP